MSGFIILFSIFLMYKRLFENNNVTIMSHGEAPPGIQPYTLSDTKFYGNDTPFNVPFPAYQRSP